MSSCGALFFISVDSGEPAKALSRAAICFSSIIKQTLKVLPISEFYDHVGYVYVLMLFRKIILVRRGERNVGSQGVLSEKYEVELDNVSGNGKEGTDFKECFGVKG